MQQLPQEQQRRPIITLKDMIGRPAKASALNIIAKRYDNGDRWSEIALIEIEKHYISLLEDGQTSPMTSNVCTNVPNQSCWGARCPHSAERWTPAGDARWSWTAMAHDRDRHLQKEDVAHIIPNGIGKRPEDEELRGARDSLRERTLTDTYLRFSACCAGRGAVGMDLPCCFRLVEVCCLGGTMRLINCWEHDGCLSITSESCCCITGFERPIDSNPGIGSDLMRCLSNPEGWTVPGQQGLLLMIDQRCWIHSPAQQRVQRCIGLPDAIAIQSHVAATEGIESTSKNDEEPMNYTMWMHWGAYITMHHDPLNVTADYNDADYLVSESAVPAEVGDSYNSLLSESAVPAEAGDRVRLASGDGNKITLPTYALHTQPLCRDV